MKKMEPYSNKPAPSPECSPKSEGSPSLALAESPTESCPPLVVDHRLPASVRTLNGMMAGLRDEDFAHWGAYVLEDLGILEIDKVVGSFKGYGHQIRAELTSVDGKLIPHWTQVAVRLHACSPAMSNPNAVMAALCQLVTSKLFTEGKLRAST